MPNPHPRTEEFKQKIRKALTGLKRSPEFKQKCSIAMTGERNPNWGSHHTQEHKEKQSIANKGQIPWIKGKHHTEEARAKISASAKGRPSWLKGKHIPEETKMKMRASQKKGSENHGWKGGMRLSWLRSNAKRRHGALSLGHESINEPFPGSEGHHMDREHVIFIPRELHRSVWHSLERPETMEQINTKVICWLLGVKIENRGEVPKEE